MLWTHLSVAHGLHCPTNVWPGLWSSDISLPPNHWEGLENNDCFSPPQVYNYRPIFFSQYFKQGATIAILQMTKLKAGIGSLTCTRYLSSQAAWTREKAGFTASCFRGRGTATSHPGMQMHLIRDYGWGLPISAPFLSPWWGGTGQGDVALGPRKGEAQAVSDPSGSGSQNAPVASVPLGKMATSIPESHPKSSHWWVSGTLVKFLMHTDIHYWYIHIGVHKHVFPYTLVYTCMTSIPIHISVHTWCVHLYTSVYMYNVYICTH